MATDTEIIEKKKTNNEELKPPPKYKVIVLNDNKTPVEFVIAMLISVFKHSQDNATALTLKIHNEGSAIVGLYTYEIAEQKMSDGINLARANGFPLEIKTEAE